MRVAALMNKSVKACGEQDNLARAAQIMWESDCGCVPIVDGEGRVTGILTDRDICMAAYTQGKPLDQISVWTAAARKVHTTYEDDTLEAAEREMQSSQVRRLPVTDNDGRLTGMLSLNDLARHALGAAARRTNGLSSSSVAETLAAVCQPRQLLPVVVATKTNGGAAAHN